MTLSFIRSLLFVSVFGIANSAFSKDFYLTVKRDFGVQENPVVEVDYRNTEALILRVMKPKNLSAFVAGQLDLRRAWRAPKVEDNMANALIKGFNQTKMSFDWLRVSLDRKFRESLKSQMGGGAWTPELTGRMGPGPAKMISEPEDFETVQEFSTYPDARDQKREFDVPGFFFSEEGQFTTVALQLKPLPAGFYVVQVQQGGSEGQVVLVVNDLLAQMQQTSGRAFVRVADRQGFPVSGARVRARDLQGHFTVDVKTDSNGVVELKSYDSRDSVLLIEHPQKGVAILDSEFFPTSVSFPDVYLYSDRPIYRSQDTVQFRGIVRNSESGLAQIWKTLSGGGEKKVLVKLVPMQSEQNKVLPDIKTVVTVNSFGTFAGELKVPAGVAGVFRLVARIEGADHASEIRVKDYVKPVFFVEVNSKQETLHDGEELSAQVKVQRYAGGVPSGTKIRWMLYRSRAQTPEWVEDAGLAETGSAATYFFDRYTPGEGSFLELLETKEDVAVDAAGLAQLQIKIPQKTRGAFDYQYHLKIYAQDADGNSAWGQKEFQDRVSEVVAQIRTSSRLVEKDQKVTLWIKSVKPSGASLPATKGSVLISQTQLSGISKNILEQKIKTDAQGRFQLSLPTAEKGELQIVVTLFDSKDHPSRAETSVVVSAGIRSQEKILEVKDLRILPRDETVSPGGKARALVLLPEKWGAGQKNQGTVHILVASDQIHEQQTMKVSGNSAWVEFGVEESMGTAVYLIVSYPNANSGWVQKQIRYRILKPEKILSVAVRPEIKVLNPGAKQKIYIEVKSSTGAPVVSEFSVSVVDQAILDLQPEFRPFLIDFFYPTTRLNLMTFLSSHFQGYGYGEKMVGLFKGNAGFAAPKGNPPAPLFEKDTAYWKAQVKTDEKGKGFVEFELPPNQTNWKISVVAVDDHGRFGEGRSQFQARRSHSVLLAAPGSIRSGDELDLRLTVVASEKQGPKKTPISLKFQTDVEKNHSAPMTGEVSSQVSPTFYQKVAFETAPPAGYAVLTSRLKVSEQEIRQDWKLSPVTAMVDWTELNQANASSVGFKLEPQEKITKANLLVLQGLRGALIPSLDWLVQYPHGCVEQLVNTTLPNIAFDQILGKKTLSKYLSKEQQTQLAEARQHQTEGLSRLKNYQMTDGGFSWFPGESVSHESMTYFVLFSLASAGDRGRDSSADLWKAFEYLKKRAPVPKSSAAYMMGYLETWLSANSYSKMTAERETQVRFLGEASLIEGSPFKRALVLRSINFYNSKLSPGLRDLQRQLVKAVALDLKNGLSSSTSGGSGFHPASGEWPDFVGRGASGLAFSARSLGEIGKFPEILTTSFRARLLDSFNGENFGSTFETAQTLLNLIWFFDIEEKSLAQGKVPQVELDGKVVLPTQVKTENLLGGYRLQLSGLPVGLGSHQIKVQSEGILRLVLKKTAVLDQVSARSPSADIKKSYFLVDEKTGRMTPVTAQNKWRVGDLVYVNIVLTRKLATRQSWMSSYFTVKEILPLGFSVIEQDAIYEAKPFAVKLRDRKLSRRILANDHIQWYFQNQSGVNSDSQELGFLMRAQYSGNFLGGATVYQDFYEEGSDAIVPGTHFLVERLPRGN